MSGIISIEGDNYNIGKELGQFWGNYFTHLRDSKQKRHVAVYSDYKNWLTDERDNKKDMAKQSLVKDQFPDIWNEVQGMLEGVNESEIGFKATLGGLFACCLAESDEIWSNYACSTTVLREDDGYVMVHSDEYLSPGPLVAANVSLQKKDIKIGFLSISYPFQLLGSAAGCNKYFAIQGNSIGCDKETYDSGYDRIPKTVFSRLLLEETTPQGVRNLYMEYPCSLPSHHALITSKGVFSIEVRPGEGTGGKNGVNLTEIQLKPGDKFNHTNHFKTDEMTSKWCYKDQTESPKRLLALKKYVKNATDVSTLEKAFNSFAHNYRPTPRKRLHHTMSGIFTFVARENGQPSLKTISFSYGVGP